MELIKNLWDSFENWITTSVPLGSQPILTLNLILWAFFLAFLAVIVILFYIRFVPGKLVRRLIEKEAFSEEKAHSAADLGCTSFLIRFTMRRGSSLRKIVFAVGAGDAKIEKKNFPETRFYLPEDKLDRAKLQYGGAKTKVSTIILSIVLAIAALLLAFKLIPDLASTLSNIFRAATSVKDNHTL